MVDQVAGVQVVVRAGVYAVYDSSHCNHPLSQKLDPRLSDVCVWLIFTIHVPISFTYVHDSRTSVFELFSRLMIHVPECLTWVSVSPSPLRSCPSPCVPACRGGRVAGVACGSSAASTTVCPLPSPAARGRGRPATTGSCSKCSDRHEYEHVREATAHKWCAVASNRVKWRRYLKPAF